jgi:ABC-type transporter Mla subunit MlaD
MSKRASPTAIGAFVVSALALAMVGIITLGGMQLFKKELPFVMFFDGDVGGLDVGSPLEFRGVKIGKVTKIRLSPAAPISGCTSTSILRSCPKAAGSDRTAKPSRL